MIALLILAGYVAVAAFAWTRIYGWVYRDHRRTFPTLNWSDGDRLFAIFWGGFCSVFWPLGWPLAWGLTRDWSDSADSRVRFLERFER